MFVAGALIVRQIEPLRKLWRTCSPTPGEGSLVLVLIVTLVNGAAEEVFFRGASVRRTGKTRPVLLSTAIYTLVTVATGNPMLVFAAVLMGLLFALQRRASGGILASILTHLTWSTILLLALPPIFT